MPHDAASVSPSPHTGRVPIGCVTHCAMTLPNSGRLATPLLLWAFIMASHGCGAGAIVAPDPGESDATAAAATSRANTAAAGPPASIDWCPAPGRIEVPQSTDPDARALNQEALAAHGQERFVESLAGFRESLARDADYDAARFNAACALSKLGRLDEARAELRRLLCRDLPSWATKIEEENDLTPLRSHVAADVAVVTGLYQRALQTGAMLVVHGHEDAGNRNWVQAVAYDVGSQRIVPVGPRASHRGREIPMVATYVDPVLQRGVAVRYRGNEAEDPHLDGIQVTVFEAPVGTPWATSPGPPPEDAPHLLVGLQQGAALVRGMNAISEPIDWHITPRGAQRTRGALPDRYLRMHQGWWRVRQPAQELEITQGTLVGPNVSIPLGRGHRLYEDHTVLVNPAGTVAVAVSSLTGDCGPPDRYVLEVIDLAGRTSVRREASEGQVIGAFGPDGSLYLQRQQGTHRYPDPASPVGEALPAGLDLSSAFRVFNPGC